MADFVEVMRAGRRMCRGTKCEKCPLHNIWQLEACPFMESFFGGADDALAERVALEWAKTHPEPQFPSYEQYCETARILGISPKEGQTLGEKTKID